MSLHDKPQLNSRTRRVRKAQLAARDGRRCTYCFRPFETLREATLDHVVPLSLFRTWSARNLVLACRPCNTRKGNRLPLLIALMLCAHGDSSRPTVHGGSAVNTSVHPTVQPTESVLFTVDWLALARFASADESAARSARDLHESALQAGGNAQPVHGEQSGCAGVHRPTVRPDCLRAPARLRSCAPVQEATV